MADINMTSSYDGRGNVTLYGASATSDGNGVVTMSLNGDRPEAIAVAHVTLILQTEVDTSRRYYLLRSSVLEKPDRPTTNPPVSPWTETEPTYTAGSNDCLYFVDLTVFTDGSFSYSEVSLSSSYEAAKDASKTATNYMYFDGTSLQVGNKESGSWSGYRTQMSNSEFSILDSSSDVLSSYGAGQIVLGKTDSNNTLIDTNGVFFRNISTNLGSFTPSQIVLGKTSSSNSVIDTTGVSFRTGTTELGRFAPSQIILGKANSNNTLIDTNGISFRSNDTELGKFTPSKVTLGMTGTGNKNVIISTDGMTINNGGTTMASFAADTISLGANNAASTITLCKNAGSIRAYNTSDASQGVRMYGGSNNVPQLALNNQGAFLQATNTSSYYSVNEISCYATGVGMELYSNEKINAHVLGGDIELATYDGGDIVFRVGNGDSNHTSWSPYHRDGEKLTVSDCRTAGFVTNSSKDIYFMVPLTKPVISGTTANVTMSVTSVTLQLRQNGNYTHGTTSKIAPSTATATYVPGVGIHVKCTMAATTNAVNNAPVGVDFSGTFTF